MKKLPLKNTETQNIPIGPRLHKEIGKDVKLKSSKKISDQSEPDSVVCQYERPSLHTTSKLLRVINEAKAQRPNINQLMEEKLASPNTAKYVRKKKASKMTIVESKNIFQELVSLDVSGTGLIQGIEEDLRRRACSVQPLPKPADPEPCMSDYFEGEEFLNVRTVGPSDIFPLPPPRTPYVTDQRCLNKFIGTLLGDDHL